MNKKILKAVDFHPAHLDLMELREHELKNTCLKTWEDTKVKFEALAMSGVSGTLIYDNKILCCMGTFEHWKGMCELWLLPSKAIEDHKLVFGRFVKQQLINLEKVGNYHRIQATAVADSFHYKFFNWLEFTLETPHGMKKFTKDGTTYNMWARVK